MSKRIRKTISAKELEKARACESEIEKFKKVFGTGRVVINKANLELARKNNLGLCWFVCRILSGTSIDKDLSGYQLRPNTSFNQDAYDALLDYLNEKENK